MFLVFMRVTSPAGLGAYPLKGKYLFYVGIRPLQQKRQGAEWWSTCISLCSVKIRSISAFASQGRKKKGNRPVAARGVQNHKKGIRLDPWSSLIP
jgi:hypothetical protein